MSISINESRGFRMYYTEFETTLCPLILVGDESGLKRIHMETGEGKREMDIDPSWVYNEEIFFEAKDQLTQYFEGRRTTFNLKLNPEGTVYQKKVWQSLMDIPYGELRSYKDVAIAIGNEKASRAIGSANGKNPLPIVVPCHRVIGSNGKLTGFAFGTGIKEKMLNQEMLVSVYNMLYDTYGSLNWWPAETDYEMMVGAILTQNTTWVNVEKSIANFKGKLTPEYVNQISTERLADYIRPSGFYTQKAESIKALTEWFGTFGYVTDNAEDVDTNSLREALLELKGIGKETADCILLYAFKRPSFVIDAYTRRIFERLGLGVPTGYDDFRQVFMSLLPKDQGLYNNYHALIVEHAKTYCNKVPKCEECPLASCCKYAEKHL